MEILCEEGILSYLFTYAEKFFAVYNMTPCNLVEIYLHFGNRLRLDFHYSIPWRQAIFSETSYL